MRALRSFETRAFAAVRGGDARGFAHDGADPGVQRTVFRAHGRLSPLDGIGPKEIGLDVLQRRLSGGEVTEVIVATNFTHEGEATAHYISEMLKGRGLRVSRIARGVPVGGELEYVDSGTLAQAFVERRSL